MKRKLGIPCIVLGAALLLGALLLSRANQMADLFAWESAVAVMPELVGQIQSNAGSDASKPDKTPDPDPQKPSDLLTEEALSALAGQDLATAGIDVKAGVTLTSNAINNALKQAAEEVQ